MSRPLINTLTSRQSIAAANILLALLMFQGVWDIGALWSQLDQYQHHMEEILEGLGTILVAFGVALEERETLMKLLGVYPEGLTPQQEQVDHHCHGYGLFLLLVGLFVEVSVYIIRMPDLNTVDFDPGLIVAGTLLTFYGGALLLRLAWLLYTTRPQGQSALGAAGQ